jgi:hypothetical protein
MIHVWTKQVHVTNLENDNHTQNTDLRICKHGCQWSNSYRDYTWVACRSISEDYGRTSRITYDDAIMSPLLGSEKSSAVCIIMGHTY